MKIQKIKLGFEIKTGKEVEIAPSHLIVTGLTQEAGKTTTLESLIKRSKKRAIVFRTKIGEKSFLEGTKIPPYFKDRSDWQFIQGLVEATIKEKLRSWDRSVIIRLSKQTGGNSLLDFKKKVDERLETPKLNNFERDILTNLQAYLEIVLPKLQSINFSSKLELVEGLNIIDLERFSRDPEVQSLVISSVVEEVLNEFKDVIIVIPESWKFLPQKRGNICKLAIEEFIRQGATNNNYVWIDSQDMSNVDKVPLKQISTWILGYQSEKNEVKHTLDQIPLPSKSKPKPEDIMSLGLGIFYLATRERTIKTYVQPFWLDDSRSKKVALGKLKVSELDAPEKLTPFKVAMKQPEKITEKPSIDFQETSKRFQKELTEMRHDFFDKFGEMQEQINKTYVEIYNIKNQPKQEFDEEVFLGKVLQKLPTSSPASVTPVSVDKESIIKDVLSRMPTQVGANVYEVAPLVKITKDFLEEAKNKIISHIEKLDDKQKRMLKWIEQNAKNTKRNEIFLNCFGKSATSGSAYTELAKKVLEMKQLEIIRVDTAQRIFPHLKERITDLIKQYKATDEEIENVYNHVLMEMIK